MTDRLPPEMRERESIWWCLRRQIRVVGGWHIAIWCLPLVWDSARQIQDEIKESNAGTQALLERVW